MHIFLCSSLSTLFIELCFTFLCAMTIDLIERISQLVQKLDLLYGDSQLSFFFLVMSCVIQGYCIPDFINMLYLSLKTTLIEAFRPKLVVGWKLNVIHNYIDLILVWVYGLLHGL
jgi:hypothetical protein